MDNKTAVEWLVWEFSEILGAIKTEPMQDMLLFDAIKQAKKMEKEQIKDAWLSAWKDSMINPLEDKYYEPEAEQYYNETYGNLSNVQA
jgi:hypothetical protein